MRGFLPVAALASLLLFTATILLPDWWIGLRVDAGTDAALYTQAVAGLRQAILLFSGGLIAVFGLYYTDRRHRLERSASELARDSNLTDRFSSAISHLESGAMAVRLGGIYALERIANESAHDANVVEDVLAAYLRSESASIRTAYRQYLAERAAAIRDQLHRSEWPEAFRPPEDSAAAFRIIARRSGAHRRPLDLSRIVLPNIKLDPGANLTRCEFTDAILTGASMPAAQIGEASFSGAEMRLARFRGAQAAGADLRHMQAEASVWDNADLRGARLANSDLSRANLHGANLENAQFGMESTVLDIRYANIVDHSGLYGITNVSVPAARLSQAVLSDANVDGAKFHGARLDDTDLSGLRGWTDEQLDQAATWSRETVWPTGRAKVPETKP